MRNSKWRAGAALALALGATAGVHLGHPFAGALVGYVAYLLIAAHAFREALPGVDEALFPTPQMPGAKR